MIRPCSTHLASLANNVAEKLVKLVLAAPLAGLLAILFRDQVALPGDVVRWALFTVSILLAAGISFCLDVVVGSLTFWLEDIAAIDRLRTLMARTLSGALIPLALFPAELEELLSIQPFRFVVSFPLEVLLGRPAEGLFVGFAVQFAWFLGFLCAATGCWRLGLRSYQGSGA